MLNTARTDFFMMACDIGSFLASTERYGDRAHHYF